MTSPDDDALKRRFGSENETLALPADAPDLHRQLAARGVVRWFTGEPVPFDLLHRLCALALCAPTKSDLQQRDIVIVDDAKLKDEILGPLAVGPIGQPWLKKVPALLIFAATTAASGCGMTGATSHSQTITSMRSSMRASMQASR